MVDLRIVSSWAESVNFDESSSFKVGDLVVEVEDGSQSYVVTLGITCSDVKLARGRRRYSFKFNHNVKSVDMLKLRGKFDTEASRSQLCSKDSS